MRKIQGIVDGKMVCCNDCGDWFPSDKAFIKLYRKTAFMLCPKCVNKLEQELRRHKSKLAKGDNDA